MPNLYPKKFANPETLRKIRRDLLIAWLNPAAAYLERRGFLLPAPESARSVDYDKLGSIFMEPTPDMPAALVDSIFLIHGMASPQGMEILSEAAETHGLEM